MDVSAKYIFNSFTESDIIISRGNHRLNCVRSLDKLMLHVQLSDCVHRLELLYNISMQLVSRRCSHNPYIHEIKKIQTLVKINKHDKILIRHAIYKTVIYICCMSFDTMAAAECRRTGIHFAEPSWHRYNYFGRTSIFVGGSVVYPFHDKIHIGEITNVSFD